MLCQSKEELMTMKRLFTFVLLSSVCVAAQAAPKKQDNNKINVSTAVVQALPAGSNTTAAYVTLTSLKQNDALIGAQCHGAKKTELHSTVHQGGVVRMRQIDKIALPKGQSVKLQQGGNHLMLTGLSRSLEVGKTLECTLKFAHAGDQKVRFSIRRVGMNTNKGNHKH